MLHFKRKPGRRLADSAPTRRRKKFDAQDVLEGRSIKRLPFHRYQARVKRLYGGPRGAILAACSKISLHEPLGELFFRSRKFDVRGKKSFLDIGSGAGQLAKHHFAYGDADAHVTCLDVSFPMLGRARTRLSRHGKASYVVGDMRHLPFADESFDCLTCGYALEYLVDPACGLEEMFRVMQSGGRLLLLTTEDDIKGAITSRAWYCRTNNRAELLGICKRIGFRVKQELWFSRIHQLLRAGGICLDLEKP